MGGRGSKRKYYINEDGNATLELSLPLAFPVYHDYGKYLNI